MTYNFTYNGKNYTLESDNVITDITPVWIIDGNNIINIHANNTHQKALTKDLGSYPKVLWYLNEDKNKVINIYSNLNPHVALTRFDYENNITEYPKALWYIDKHEEKDGSIRNVVRNGVHNLNPHVALTRFDYENNITEYPKVLWYIGKYFGSTHVMRGLNRDVEKLGAFSHSYNLKNITINNSVKYIREFAFYHIPDLNKDLDHIVTISMDTVYDEIKSFPTNVTINQVNE